MTSLLEEMESHQQNSTTPGWNDPPPSIPVQNLAVSNNNRLHLQRLRRPVDPSIQGNLLQNSTQQNTKQQELTATTNSNFHQSRSFPQLNHGPMSAMVLGTHPGSAFSPAQSNVNSSQSQISLASIRQNYPVTNPPPQMAAIHHPHSHPNLLATLPSTLVNSLPHPAQAQTGQSIPLLANPVSSIQQSSLTANFDAHYDPIGKQQSAQPPNLALPILPNPVATAFFFQSQHPNSSIDSSATLQQVMPQAQVPNNGGIVTMAAVQNEEPMNGQHSVIFSPPNIVPMRVDQQCRPTTQPIPNEYNYKVPVKAAGDVSLSGVQLAAFLTKATILLPQGPMREGIQLRINQFGEFVQNGQISDPCLKKLNFVVDAIDRQIYDEASQFFEQMLVAYQNDCSMGGWAHGIRLLIQQLRGQQLPNRAHSAGARQHF